MPVPPASPPGGPPLVPPAAPDGDASDGADLTGLLNAATGGDAGALDRLVPLLYDELRHLAHHRLARERADHTLGTTALVHEAYLKIAGGAEMTWESRRHFFATAAQAMRRVLINYAHAHRAARRGGAPVRAGIDVDALSADAADAGSLLSHLSPADLDHVLDLDDALHRLAAFNPRGATVVAYHYFAGLTYEEIADVMDLSPTTVRRAWAVSRSWLRRELGGAPSGVETGDDESR